MKTFLYAVISYIFWQVVAITSNCHSDSFWVQDVRFDFIIFLGFLIIWFGVNVMNSDIKEHEIEDANKPPTAESIPKDQYINRLKADMVAILYEFDLELYEQYDDTDLIKVEHIRQAIQQKIDALKAESED